MDGGIFLVGKDGELVEMKEKEYEKEDILQELLAKYPNLLAGDQIDDENPRRWLLIAREMEVPDEEEGSGRWSLDHLFLDQDGIPTLVEVKRISDSRIRREVVAQMLDYAANAVSYWSIETIPNIFEKNCEKQNKNPEEILENFLQGIDAEKFWQNVKTNLEAGKIRMLFVADEIPKELKSIVEFLNRQMNPAEVLAVEIKQYASKDLKTLVPRVFGQTAIGTKSGAGRQYRRWDEESFFDELKKHPPEVSETAQKIYDWAKKKMTRIDFGRGANVSFQPRLINNDEQYTFSSIFLPGAQFEGVQISFGSLQNTSAFKEISKRLEFLNLLNGIPNVRIAKAIDHKYPLIPFSSLKDPSSLKQFFEAMEWAIKQIKQEA